MIKILAIGNSFSTDATRWLEDIAVSAGAELFVRNLFIGGCSLETHLANIKSGAKVYAYQESGADIRSISVSEALAIEEWDYVTVQQASHFSGKYETYEPYLTEIISYIKAVKPRAKIVFHRTWPYEKDAEHSAFPDYGCDRSYMWEQICLATERVLSEHELPVIDSGGIVYRLGETDSFNKDKGGVSLYRDGYHMEYTYGRYLVGLVWFKFFTGIDLNKVTFIPEGADAKVIEKLKMAL